MRIRAMRNIDRFAGIPLCWITGLLAHLPRFRPGPPPARRWRTILVIKFFGLGSILLAGGFLAQLRRANPSARIVFITFRPHAELLERLPYGLEIHTVPTDNLFALVRGTMAAVRKMRALRPDAVFDLEFFSKFSTLLSALSGAPLRVGFSLPARWRSLNLTHGIPFDHTIHVSALFVEQLSPFEFDPAGDPDFPVLRSTAEERQSMRRKLSLGENGCTVVTINMNAGQTSLERRWPPERFTEVARKLAAGPGRVRFLFTGSAGERAYIDSALEAEPLLAACSTNCAGILSLGEFIAALEVSSVFLTNDSGPMHIAAAVGTPTVALFGPESPHFYGPLRNASIIYKQISCSPCLNVYTAKLHLCPFNARCMREITVEDVLASLRPILVSSARRQALLSPAVTA